MSNKYSFSQRMGYSPKAKVIQINSVDEDLRNKLWNTIKFQYLDILKNYEERNNESVIWEFTDIVWHNFFKLSVETKSNYPLLELKEWFFNKFPWNQIYDFIEFLLKNNFSFINKDDFTREINYVLEEEFAGYRLKDDLIVPITNEVELKEIEEVSNLVFVYPQFKFVGLHLSSALEKLSNRQKPDYRNSIKESISAVEALCRQLTSEQSLGKALAKLESKGVLINQEFKKGLEKLYGYTNSKESGIRHAIIGDHIETKFEEAKFMLVSCSAFINYLIGISNELKNN